MYIFLAHILTSLLSYGTEDFLYPIDCEQRSLETVFDTNVHVDAIASYPHMPETNLFACHVNEVVRKEAHALHDIFVQQMSAPQQESWKEVSDERTLSFGLSLIHSTPTFLSFYGSKYIYSGGAHGSVQYLTKTFWQKNAPIYELQLKDLFLSQHQSLQFLLQYCENYFRSHKYGYYFYEDPEWPELCTDHLDAFILTKTGLLLIFQNYVVDGLTDDPITLLIPYVTLAPFTNPDGPIPAFLQADDHWMTTNAPQTTTDIQSSQ